MVSSLRVAVLAFAVALLAVPSISDAGAPLICQPFNPGTAAVLPWGSGPDWNSPARGYDVQRLTADMLRLLTPEAPVIARMENMRRATIYAARDARVAQALLDAVVARAQVSADPHALFDAGYLIETYKQGSHLHRQPPPTVDGYAMVRQALARLGSNRDMQYASRLMRGDD